LIANKNRAAFLTDCLLTAAWQSVRDIEIIVVDNASTDDSVEIARAFARRDARVRIIELEADTGPAGTRNAGLAEARGRWLAIFDSDDLMHPLRLHRLLEEAERSGAQICADDLLIFQHGVPPKTLLAEPGNTPR
jgi:glycosyltransferase involved in cell wall biosynthesis